MGFILHLTDLHLGLAPDTQDYGDYKSNILRPNQRTTRRTLLENTLQEIAEAYRSEGELDAVIVSGDVTVRGSEDGFNLLRGVLEKLGPLLPPPERVLVVPGNHDVAWKTPASTRPRYAHFLRYIRRAGYVTPFLDGIDIDDNGSIIGTDRSRHHVLSPAGDYALFAINSSNWCGSLEPVPLPQRTWNRLPTIAATKNTRGKIAAALDELRLRDVARVSDGQLRALQGLIREVERDTSPVRGQAPMRLAVLHHQLLPVSTFEEFKPFEAITNLGLVREFLRAMDIAAVLHGHKHHGFIYKDHIYSPERGLDEPPHEVLVAAGSTVGGTNFQTNSICRLLRVEATPGAGALAVTNVPGVSSGSTLPVASGRPYSLVQPTYSLGGPHLVDVQNASEAYARLVALCKRPQRTVVCRVRDAESADRLPAGYPAIGDIGEDPEAWFRDIVKWWERPDSRLGKRLDFRHGHRVYAYDDGLASPAYNQVKAAARTLAARPKSTRGIVVLVDPRTDKAEDARKFPSFCIAHLMLREEDGRHFLDCTGYFRKQEIAYWWPVNLAELRYIQREAKKDMVGVEGLELGTLTTVAAIAHTGVSKPAVAVPLVDRHFDEEPERLWEAVYSIVADDIRDKRPVFEVWNRYLSDVMPAEEPDPDGVPVAIEGINYLREEAKKFATHHPTSILGRLADDLEELLAQNNQFASENDQSPEDVDRAKYLEWRREVERSVGRIRRHLEEIEPEAPSQE